jgi:hypothetical protein
MPGKVIGRTTKKLMVLRPKNSWRCTAKATMVPSTSAITVAPRPTITELPSEAHMPSLFHASAHQRSVKPLGGKANVRDELNALTTTRSSGA